MYIIMCLSAMVTLKTHLTLKTTENYKKLRKPLITHVIFFSKCDVFHFLFTPINVFYRFAVTYCDIPLLKNQNTPRKLKKSRKHKKRCPQPFMASATSCTGNLFNSNLEKEFEDYSRQHCADRNGNKPGHHDTSGYSPFHSGEAFG